MNSPTDDKTGSEADTRELSPNSTPRLGDVIAGRYRIDGDLGQGGMAKVYRVHDLELDEQVALKILSQVHSDNTEMVDQFRQEIKLARRVVHTNVCRIYDFGRWQDLLFVTMEVVEGETLATLIERQELGGFNHRLKIFRDILIGLRAAHSIGIVHLDIKPLNIMITADERTVLMDFGLAGERGHTGAMSDGMLLGTPAYMPPERFMGEPVDARTDIYSLGVLLFELTTGQLPFPGQQASEIIRSHLQKQPPDVRALDSEVPDAIGRAIEAMLVKKPADRLASVDQVLEILAEIRGEGEGHTAVLALGDGHLQALVSQHFEAVGLTVRAALDGEQVIEEVLREIPDVIVLDVQIEKIDGFRVAEILRLYGHLAEVPVFVLSNSSNKAYSTYARQLEITRLVRRPCASRELAYEVKAAAGHSSSVS